jgi:hypothetical protein
VLVSAAEANAYSISFHGFKNPQMTQITQIRKKKHPRLSAAICVICG